ncbi:hypothetical protein DSL92_00865 [Billgrantia gudaonensis]|uniref:Uncharacterized protein n=1 Tax=Billgrantia gudaonensis TaxID=376427 RepID=A0A3S0NF99_9GAMM|nr:hypothetical protein DSL92_00865 [Halomonas gudaonensis]
MPCTSAQVVAREGNYATLRLRPAKCARCWPSAARPWGSEQPEHSLRQLGKAGAKRWRGVRRPFAAWP